MNYITELKKILNKTGVVTIIILIIIISACSSGKEWLPAKVVYYDDFSEELLVRPKKATYYTFVKSKHLNNTKKIKILIPEEVKLIEGKDFTYVYMFFDEKDYGMESWSFGRVIAGDSIKLVETKFQFKTCACKTAGKFFYGYFILVGETKLKIKTDNKNNVYNRSEIYNFIDANSDTPLPKGINTVEDLITFLENINN